MVVRANTATLLILPTLLLNGQIEIVEQLERFVHYDNEEAPRRSSFSEG